MWLEALPKSSDCTEECPTCGGAVRRRAYGEMYAGSFVSHGRRVEIRKQPHESFADPVSLDPITQYFDGGLYRLWPSEKYFSRGGKKLHRDVWAAAFGHIPKGCHIHHRDADPANNRLSNLECMDATEHFQITWENNRGSRKPSEHFSDAARAASAAWHASEEGRLWHRRHAERSQSWTKWRREPRPCASCGTEINAIVRNSGHSQLYCGPNCRAAALRKRRAAERNG